MNPFIPILLNRGFVQGVSGRYFSPDARYCNDAHTVEVSDTVAFVHFDSCRGSFSADAEGLESFRKVIG